MKTWHFRGEIVFKEPFHLGSGEGDAFIDSLVVKDSNNNPVIPGTSLGGILAANARNVLRLYGNAMDNSGNHPVFRALFGSSSGKDSANKQTGRESRLVIRDARLLFGGLTFIQDRNSINRKKESSETNHLFHDEAVSSKSRFQFSCEFREKEPLPAPEEDADINRRALALLLKALHLLERGWASAGGKKGSGHGRFEIEGMRCFTFDRSEPDDVLTTALEGADGLKDRKQAKIASLRQEKENAHFEVISRHYPAVSMGPEILVISGVLRPYEPLLVKTGLSLEQVEHRESETERANNIQKLHTSEYTPDNTPVPVDSAFCRTPDDIPYVPGSSIRGCLRSRAEKMIRTFIYNRFKNENHASSAAWDLDMLEKKGRQLKNEKSFDVLYHQACIVSKVFGFSALGGRVSFSDANPIKPKAFTDRLKLIDNVAIDRFKGGAADKKKFNSRPYFPYHDPSTNEPDDAGDLEFRIVLEDFELWHLGMIALLLKDLHNGNIIIGYGKKKGNGKVRLVPGETKIEALTGNKGCLKPLCNGAEDRIGGFIHIPETKVSPGNNFWAETDNNSPLYKILYDAVSDFKSRVISWQPEKIQQQAVGVTNES